MRYVCVLLSLTAAAWGQPSPAGKWISVLTFHDDKDYSHMELTLDGTKLTGKVGNNAFEGTFENGRITGTIQFNPTTTGKVEAHLEGEGIVGTASVADWKMEAKWEAHREAARSDAAQTHTFEPTTFQHFFSDSIAPVLHIHPGDTVKTWSVDAGGTDPKGVRRTSGGNPLTGPFYVEGAVPGDMLVVHFNRIRLNRDSAISSPLIVNSALNVGYVAQRKPVEGYNSDWKIDREAGVASLQKPTDKLKDYRVPLAPMLGCVGVAPPGNMQYRSGFLGSFGGNMDYNQLREGVTVYLPVYVPGALLFVGDGHALQGAGELTGNALETSMDIEFTVNVEASAAPGNPRFENADYLMASGIAGSVDEAFRNATTNLVRWLEKKYGLNAAEVSSVLGTVMVYDVAEVVDPFVHIVAKVPKARLAALKPVN
ncbi:MAG TPA: acetamidase/formamidase family protein [Bryobacteraceae bacterium]|nr:acetamidase/formamidase family protein [Bryobacteraceae bacterium]